MSHYPDIDLTSYFPNFERIKRLAGPNETWPGRPVYCYGSTRLGLSKEALQSMRSEASDQGWELEIHQGHVYLVGPQQETP